jgi:hypothetical protein
MRPSPTLPRGFLLKTGDEVSSAEKGLVHAKAFGYVDQSIYVTRASLGFEAMARTSFWLVSPNIQSMSLIAGRLS